MNLLVIRQRLNIGVNVRIELISAVAIANPNPFLQTYIILRIKVVFLFQPCWLQENLSLNHLAEPPSPQASIRVELALYFNYRHLYLNVYIKPFYYFIDFR